MSAISKNPQPPYNVEYPLMKKGMAYKEREYYVWTRSEQVIPK